MDQLEQLKKAKFAYIMPLNKKQTRFAVYLDGGQGEVLDVLWPDFLPDARGSVVHSELLPLQVFSKLKSFPAYHFLDMSCGNGMLEMVKEISPKTKILLITGKSPNNHFLPPGMVYSY